MLFIDFQKRYQSELSEEDFSLKEQFSFTAYDSLLETNVEIMMTPFLLRPNISNIVQLKHPNIQGFLTNIDLQLPNHKKKKIIVLEAINHGTFNDFLKSFPSEAEVFTIIRDVLNGLIFLHAHNLVYGGLSMRKVYVHKSEDIICGKLSVLPLLVDQPSVEEQDTMGKSKVIAPPEVLRQSAPSVKSDIWTVGAMLYELFSGETFWSNDSKEYQNNLHSIPPPYHDIIKKSLLQEQENRANPKEILTFLEVEINKD